MVNSKADANLSAAVESNKGNNTNIMSPIDLLVVTVKALDPKNLDLLAASNKTKVAAQEMTEHLGSSNNAVTTSTVINPATLAEQKANKGKS